jgi:uncharacterized protein (DUF1697 family)
MNTYIALFRGINVVGKNLLPMKDLELLLERAGCLDVRIYIQSGNAIFRHATSDVPRLAERLAAAVSKSRGSKPHVLVLTRAELKRAADRNPFPEACADPRNLHVFFLAEPPAKPNLEACEALKAATERFELKGRLFYLHTPDGFGPSKLASRAEKLLGVAATARNWRTVTTLLGMCSS